MTRTSDEPTLTRRITSGAIWALAGRTTTAVSVLATNAILARLIGPSELGTYFLALSLATTGALVGGLGLNQTVQSTVAASLGVGNRERARHLIEVIAAIGLACAVMAAIVYLLIGDLVATELFGERTLLAVNVLVAAWIFFLATQTLFAETLRALQDLRMASVMAGALSGVLVSLSLLVLLVVRGASSLTTVVVVSVGCAGAVSIAAGGVVTRRARELSSRVRTGDVKVMGILGATWPQFVTMLAASRMTIIPLWVVSASASQDDVALFGTASRLAFTVVIPFGLVTAVVPPIIAELWARDERARLGKVLRVFAGVVFVPVSLVSVVLLLFGDDLLTLAFGEFYGQGAPVLGMLVAGYWVNAAAGACGEVLMMTGHQRTMMTITLISVGILTAACLLVVDDYGVRGVAAVTAGAFVLQNLLMLLAARRACGLWTHADPSLALRHVRALPAMLRP